MKEAAFLMRNYGMSDPFDLTPQVWHKLMLCAVEEVA